MTDSAAGDGPTKTLTASCYCKSVQYSVDIPTALLPLPVHLCHCSICRYTHGTLCAFHAALPGGRSPSFTAPSSPAAMTGYRHAGAQAERFFCSTCGCHVGDRGLDAPAARGAGPVAAGAWIVATPLFAEHGEAVFRIAAHCFTEGGSAGGAGLFTWLPRVGGRDVEVWNPAPGAGWWSAGLADDPPRRELDADGHEVLRAACHCGGVSFTIPRPADVPAVRDDAYLSGYVSPPRDGDGDGGSGSGSNSNRWLACLDACGDCRLQTGALVTAWAFVPRAVLRPPMPPGLAPYGTLRTFDSSPGVRRGFCGACGATVVYSCAARAPTPAREVVDVAVGLLRAPEGVLAEGWVAWRADRPANMEDARRVNPSFARSLEEGHRKWSLDKYGYALDMSIN